MALSYDTINAAELALFDADKPVILAANAIRDGVATKEVWSQTGNTTDTDHTASFARQSRAHDGLAHPGLHTYPDANQATWYLSFQLATPQTIDSLIICGSNLSTALTIDVQIADDATFATNLESLTTIAVPTDETRIVELDFDFDVSHARVTDLEFLRLKVTHSSGFAPRIRELWLGNRVQLDANPETPVDDQHYAAAVTQADSKSGVVTQSSHERGGARREIGIALKDSAAAATVETFWDNCREGTEPFWWIETPSTNPQAYLMRYDGSPEFNPVNIGNNTREWVLPMREQNPFLALEP